MTRRILLIEDEQLSQDIITALLRGQGYAVDVAVDGFSALEQARTQRYDVALVDYHLPEMDGYTLGRLLREQHAGAQAGPILIGLTADSNGLAARRGSDAVFRAILPKPIKPAELFSTIERLCDASGCAAEAAPAMAHPAPDAARRSAAALWRSHGLAAPPKAFASPRPTAEQAAALNLCFDLVGPDEAQCVVLLERHGINEALRVARRGQSAPLPIIGFSADHADICDRLFQVDDAASWKALAATLGAEAAAVVPFPAASAQSAPDRAEPSPVIAAVIDDAAAAPEPRPAILATGASIDPLATTELRAVLLAGVQTPLDALRRDLIAEEGVAIGDVCRKQRPGQIDAILLAVGAIGDALNPTRPSSSEFAEFDPAEFVGNALAMIRDSRPPGAVRLAHRTDDGLPGRLRADAHRLSQIVLTLLDDACAGPAPVALILHTSFDATRASLVLRLAHEAGQALPEAGDAVVALLRRLRLTTLSRLVQLMGGHLDQQDGLVVLSVPAEPAVETRLRPDADGGENPVHVLLVDDGATSGQLLTLLLTQKGHRVSRVGDGEAAAFACRHARHDLVVFDLPHGAEARLVALAGLRAFRAAVPDVPAIVLADDEARRHDLGGVPVLAKPFSPDALDQAVAACRRHIQQADAKSAESIDRAVRDGLLGALGEAAVTRLTWQLLEQIEALAAAPGLESEARLRLIELAGCASVLGLADLARQCAKPELAATRGALLRLGEALDAPRRSAA
jgi:CheY-like chemotaxis protein